MLITNAFSINMLKPDIMVQDVLFVPLSVDEARDFVKKDGAVSAIGHVDTALLVSNILGIPLEASRINVTLPDKGMIVAQYSGPRLPEGATTLPEGAKIDFWWVW